VPADGEICGMYSNGSRNLLRAERDSGREMTDMGSSHGLQQRERIRDEKRKNAEKKSIRAPRKRLGRVLHLRKKECLLDSASEMRNEEEQT